MMYYAGLKRPPLQTARLQRSLASDNDLTKESMHSLNKSVTLRRGGSSGFPLYLIAFYIMNKDGTKSGVTHGDR